MLKAILTLTITASLASGKTGRWGVEEENGVGVVTDDNFNKFVAKSSNVLIVFYHPDLATSKTVLEILPKVAARLKDSVADIPIGKLNVLDEDETARLLEVKKVPVVRLFGSNVPKDYTLDFKNEDLLVSWITKNSGHLSTELKTEAEFKKAEKSRLACHLFMEEMSQKVLDEFNKLSLDYPEIPFYYAVENEVRKNYKTEHKYTFIVWRDFDDFHKMLGANEDKLNYKEMKGFLDIVKNPLVKDLTREMAQSIWSGQKATLIIFSDDPKSTGIQALRTLAPDFDGLNLIYAVSPITTDFGREMARFFGLSENDQDCARIMKFENRQILKYKLDKVTESSLKTFTDDYKNKKLQPYYKSDSVHEKNNGLVKTVVGNSYESEVLNSDKHILLWAWAAFSDRCRILSPVYEQLAIRLKNEPSIVLAKMNGVTNEHPKFILEGFPTIQLFKKDNKEHPVSFSGELTLDKLVEFLASNLNISIDGVSKGAVDEGL
jgi:protein disulfide isomerase